MAYIFYLENDSRYGDPNLHLHLFIFNATKDPSDPKKPFKAFSAIALFRAQKLLSKLFHELLEQAVQKLGYDTVACPENGAFEIAGIPRSLINKFSKGHCATGSVLTSSFDYDSIGQLLSASVPSASSAVKNYTYGCDLAGNRTQEQIDSGVTTSVHNNLNQLTGQSPGGAMEFAGTLNEPGTVTLAGKPANVDGSNNWTGKANVTAGANAIPLVATDASGNSTTKTINLVVSGGTARTLAFDLAGNETDNGAGQSYTYDALNRLKTVTQGGNVSEFVYNGVGQRVQEKLNGTLIKQWIWDGGAQPAEERDAAGNVTKRFFGAGEQIAGTNYYYTTDHLGSVREMTDASGAVRARYDYDPYGRMTKVSGDLETDFGFTGFYRHQASGLSLTLFRAYDPEIGRWTRRDPMGEAGGFNLYAYVGNNPLNGWDPLGLKDYFNGNPFTFWPTYNLPTPSWRDRFDDLSSQWGFKPSGIIIKDMQIIGRNAWNYFNDEPADDVPNYEPWSYKPSKDKTQCPSHPDGNDSPRQMPKPFNPFKFSPNFNYDYKNGNFGLGLNIGNGNRSWNINYSGNTGNAGNWGVNGGLNIKY